MVRPSSNQCFDCGIDALDRNATANQVFSVPVPQSSLTYLQTNKTRPAIRVYELWP